ncbi:MAG: CPBP family intramembrane metalloprotease [Acholeplasmataceae bacterium]|nr:CPBP family intramembrane metalloprotease [Acholeplasmataceae bacterium]
MSERLIKKMGLGNFYLLAFIIAFALFYFLQLILMFFAIGVLNYKNPGFFQSFQAALNNMSLMTDTMWAVQNVSQFAGELILAVLIVAFFWKAIAEDFKLFIKDWKSNLLTVLFSLVIIVLSSLAMQELYNLFGISGSSENQEMIESALESNTSILMLLTVLLLAPFIEEILFRKLLFGVVEEKIHLKPIFAIIISALFFSALHALDIFYFQYLPLALVLCVSYYLSKNNIFVPMLIHLINNSTVLLYLIIVGI